MPAFAIGRYEVTFDEYDVFAWSTGAPRPTDEGWGRGRRPVINVSWNDAKAYVEWLRQKTGRAYRLLSESEWEYAARAATRAGYQYWWGDGEPTPEQANHGRNSRGTTEVGTYLPNPWGLHDMNGNVWEWVEDRWHQSYEGAPDDGSAWTSGNCDRRVLRGGSWDGFPEDLRSAFRHNGFATGQGNNVGFRVARTLSRSDSIAP